MRGSEADEKLSNTFLQFAWSESQFIKNEFMQSSRSGHASYTDIMTMLSTKGMTRIRIKTKIYSRRPFCCCHGRRPCQVSATKLYTCQWYRSSPYHTQAICARPSWQKENKRKRRQMMLPRRRWTINEYRSCYVIRISTICQQSHVLGEGHWKSECPNSS